MSLVSASGAVLLVVTVGVVALLLYLLFRRGSLADRARRDDADAGEQDLSA